MRTSKIFSIPLLFLLCWQSSNAQTPTMVKGKDAIFVRQKTTCGTTEEGRTYFGMWEGKAYSRVPGEKDKHLFNVVGINTRQCDVKKDEVRGYGFRSVSREIMMYLDPETNEILDVWENPWTGEEVPIVHVANDPVNMRGYSYEKNKAGDTPIKLPLRVYGDVAVTSYEIPLFYSNPLGGEYQAYVGGSYHAMEIFNSYYKSSELLDNNVKDLTQSSISWSRVAQWLPWMKMGDKAGVMVFNATGFSTFDKSKIWENITKVIKERYPTYLTPPPLDDTRPNETSWTVFKKFIENSKE